MIIGITWREYLSWVVAALVVYYAILVVRVYGWRALLFWRRFEGGGRKTVRVEEREGGETLEVDHWAIMNSLLPLLNGVLAESETENMGIEEVEARVQGLLAACPKLRGTPAELAVNELVSRVFVERYGYMLQAEDLERLWVGKAHLGEGYGAGPAMPVMIALLVLAGVQAQAQTADGNAGINQANTLIRGYFATAVQLMYAIGAIVGLVGAVHVYMKWSRGDHDTQRVAMAWFGACIFLVVVATVIQSFFGL
ncbi:MAG TPA: DUF4134 domain-containing protein [Puia sp.]|nr:DUF4134 domain-containing protein [Puia sp.]